MEKRVQDYSKEILKIIRSNTSPAVMGERLQDYHENDLADVMPKLTVQERCKLYRILDTDMLSDIFEYTDEENAAEYLNEMDVKKAAAILSRMETDALADVLNKVEKTKKKILIDLLEPEVRRDVEMIASFDEDEIGSRMTTNYIVITEFIINIALLNDQGKLISTDTEGIVCLPDTFAQSPGNRLQQSVPHVMSISVINRLKPVQIQIEHGKFFMQLSISF